MWKLRQRFPLWALSISGAITLLAVAMLILALVLGVRAGQEQLEIKRRQQVSLILQQALEFHHEGRVEAARIAYEEVLQIDPDSVAAIEGLGQLRLIGQNGLAQSAPSSADTPQPATAPSPAANNTLPTSTALPTLAPASTATAAPTTATAALISTLARAEEAINAGRWQEAIDTLLALQAENAGYETDHVSELLFEAYVNLATEKDNQNKLEEAVALFDKALALQPTAGDVRAERTLIRHYIDAITYAEADWPAAIEALQQIYAEEPDYRDVKTRLQMALRAQGESLADAEEWCDAASLLDQAIDIGTLPGIVAERDDFQSACDTGEPVTAGAAADEDSTPTADTAGAGRATPTRGLATTGAPTVGSILYSALDATSGRSRVMLQAVDGNSAATLFREEAAQPALRQDGRRLLYRNLRADMAGLSAWDPGGDLLLRFTTYAEDTLPSWNPQSNRFVFASNREGDRIWRIYLTWAESGSETTVLSIGEAPAWHPSSDVIVFRGCDNTGNRCGLWQINSRGGDRGPLTDVPSDNRPTWSPDGRYIVFQSDGRSSSFDLYRLDVASGQVTSLTADPSAELLPTVSPDGRWVAYVSNRDGGWKLWAVPISGGTPTAIAPIAGNLGSWTEHTIQWVP
ncbi:MAG: hypothetical protein R2932_00965 [Caldilineaceae bacterium]